MVLAQPRDLGAENEIFDLNFTLFFFVAALNHHAWTAALVSVFHLRAEFAVTQIKLGTNLLSRRVLGVAQLRHQALIVGDGNIGKYRDDDGAGLGCGFDLAEMLQRRQQPRHADRNARRRHRLAAKARNQSVITPAAADGAEANETALLVLCFEVQINFVDRACVILETADNTRVDSDAARAITSCFSDLK